MRATPIEYRFRFLLHGLIFLLGFWSPWLLIPSLAEVPGFTANSTWLAVTTLVARQGWLTFGAATVVVLVISLACLGAGAWLRIWGSAYVGSSVVHAGSMHGAAMLADGPYRRTRNPLYLGTLLHTIGLAILMPPTGAVFTVALIWVLQIRLALAEEPVLEARFGPPYAQYMAAVPRFLPSPTAQVPSAGARPRWIQAVLGEIYFVGAFGVIAVYGWSFNAHPIRQGLLISLGVWMIVIALLPRVGQETQIA